MLYSKVASHRFELLMKYCQKSRILALLIPCIKSVGTVLQFNHPLLLAITVLVGFGYYRRMKKQHLRPFLQTLSAQSRLFKIKNGCFHKSAGFVLWKLSRIRPQSVKTQSVHADCRANKAINSPWYPLYCLMSFQISTKEILETVGSSNKMNQLGNIFAIFWMKPVFFKNGLYE